MVERARACVCVCTCVLNSANAGLSNDHESTSMIIFFEGNFAAGAGGAAFTTCTKLTVCKEVVEGPCAFPCVCMCPCMYVYMYVCMYLSMCVCMYVRMYVCMYIYIYILSRSVGVPTLDGTSKMLLFSSNEAGGYAENIGTAPNRLILQDYAKEYVPGKNPFLSALSVCVRVRPSFLIYVPCSYMPFLTATMHRHLLSRHHLFHAGFAGRGDCGLRASSCQPHGASARSPCRCRLQVF